MTVASHRNIIKACAPRSKKVFCKSTIKTGINRGFYCARLDCKIKSHGNFGTYLHFPKFMVEIIENNKYQFNCNFFISTYKKFSTKTLFDCKEYIFTIKNLLEKIESLTRSDIKIIFAFYMFKLLDTYSMNNFVNKHPKFKKTVDDKILEFQNYNEVSSDNIKKFIVHINQYFETGKKFLSIKKNVLENIKVV